MKLSTLLNPQSQDAVGTITPEFITAFNKDVLCRLYPNSNDKHTNWLVGIKKAAEVVEEKTVFMGIIKRLDNCSDQRLTVKLRRGITFTFIIR